MSESEVRVAAWRDDDQLVIDCPFCGREHRHGVGGPNRGDGDGGRVPHCTESRPSGEYYYLVEG
ncbi:hypothetical protein [Streptomyces sp. NPDC056672]|uniref:hypothetical protein n=1 Tax=Streptomyces sp. NPDC056672 TaxID=3345906 RepID=UPI00369229D3